MPDREGNFRGMAVPKLPTTKCPVDGKDCGCLRHGRRHLECVKQAWEQRER